MATAAVRNGKQNGHQTTTRLAVGAPAGHESHRSPVMTDTNETRPESEKLQASAEYLEERHAAGRMLDAHVAAQRRTAHHHGMIAGIRQILEHLEALAVAEAEAQPAQPAVPERPEPVQPERNIDLVDYTSWADAATYGITGVLDKTLLTREAHFLWEVSADILNRRPRIKHPAEVPYVRLSSVLLLEALIASPAAVQNALEVLRALLLEEDPEVGRLRAALGGNTPPA